MTVGWPHVGWRRPFNSYTILGSPSPLVTVGGMGQSIFTPLPTSSSKQMFGQHSP